MEMIIQGMNLVFAMVTALLTPAVILAGWLLTPDWTMGDFFGLRPYFINVWVLVSNLVYIAFALILLFLAVMQIFGSESSEYTFKKKLPQFLVGILMVPFTWLIVSWTLSFANQATAAVLSVPMGAIAGLESADSAKSDKKWLFHDRVIPRQFFISSIGNNSQVDCTTTGWAKECISAAEFVANNQSGPFFIMMIYAYDIFRIQSTDLTNLNPKECGTKVDAKECIKKLTDVVISFGTGLIVTLFFGILTIALCWVLLMRAFKLWIYVMFSPLFWLAYFTGEWWGSALHSDHGSSWDHGSGGMSQVWFKQFFKLAMVPVMVAAVLSFGLLFVWVINQTFSSAHMNQDSSGSYCTPVEGYMVRYCITPNGSSPDAATSALIIWNPNNDKSKEYTITFEFGNTFSGVLWEKNKTILKSTGSGLVDSMQSVFAHVILTLISLVIIWMWVAAAVKHDKVTEAAFAPFAKLGESVSHFVEHVPSYIPTPHPMFKALTPGGAGIAAEAMTKLTETLDEKHIHAPARSLGELLGSASLREFSGEINQARGNLEGLSAALQKQTDRALSSGVWFEKLKDAFSDAVSQANIDATQKATILQKIANAKTTSDVQDIFSIHKDVLEKAKGTNAKTREIIDRTEKVVWSPSSSGGATLKTTHEIVSWELKLKPGKVVDSQQQTAIRDSFKDKNTTPADIKRELIQDLGFAEAEVNKMSDAQLIKAREELLKQAG